MSRAPRSQSAAQLRPLAVSPEMARGISDPLVQWFRKAQRDLPWRRRADAYAVWVSEIMLQQTRVVAVIPYFERWMEQFPTIAALAAAEEADVLHAWQGLGYYSRARSLLKGAREVMARFDGRVPERVEDLLTLPGVGRYTAGAIASIAYNQPAPIVDGNVIRVLTRAYAITGDPTRSPQKEQIWQLAEKLIPEGLAREFNPALMELGATICTPQKPHCGACPLAQACEARKLSLQDRLPELPARPEVTDVRAVAALLWNAGKVLLVQRKEEEGRWAGMWQFPNTEVQPHEPSPDAVIRSLREAVGLNAQPGSRAVTIKHTVTRYRITLEAFHCEYQDGDPVARNCADWRWAAPSELDEYALPAAHRRIASSLHPLGGLFDE